jgi:hypothetical protein
VIYQFKEGAHLKGDAQAVGERLEAIRAKAGLTPEAVITDAASSKSVLHPLFDWDDTSAAHKYRLEQAGHIIRCVTVVTEPDETDTKDRQFRAFVPVSVGGRRSYEATMTALADDDMRKQVLSQAYAELGAVARKYRELKELTEVVGAIDRVGELLSEARQPA